VIRWCVAAVLAAALVRMPALVQQHTTTPAQPAKSPTATSPTLILSVSESVPIDSQNKALLSPFECDDHGAVYFREYKVAEGGQVAIQRFDRAGSLKASFSLAGAKLKDANASRVCCL
jgi:hypothetical protein